MKLVYEHIKKLILQGSPFSSFILLPLFLMDAKRKKQFDVLTPNYTAPPYQDLILWEGAGL
jgi:hypothetical protein